MKWLTRSALVLLALVGLLALVPFFVTLDDYVPLVEKELSARLEQPVSIDTLHASLLPAPHVTVNGIEIGSAEEIKVAKLILKPDLWSLLRSPKVIRIAEFEDVALSQKAINAIIALAQRDKGPGAIRIERVKLKGAVVKLDQASFGPFDAEVQGNSDGEQGEITLATRDKHLEARATPQGDRYILQISAKSWTPPLGPPVRFDALAIKGHANAAGADLTEVTAKLYGGTLTGKATLRWDEGVSLKGELDLDQVELKDAALLVSPRTRVSGRLNAKPLFKAEAAKVAELDQALRLETPFTVHKGVLHGFDLANAAAALAKQGRSGGETHFDELAGRLVIERGTYRFTQLRIASGGVSARGQITIAPNRSLSGQLNTSAKGLGRAANVPLVVAGTLDSPMLYPNATALIGAAAGTAVLGPGLGTAAGAKLGEIADGILGGKQQ